MKTKFIALIFSFGLGYDVISEDNKLKGIIQIEQTSKSISYGFLHSSSLNDGLYRAEEDQNIIYIKKSFTINGLR
jgi:hypothetical protein